MRTTALGILGGMVLGLSLLYLYYGVGIAMLACRDRHQSDECELNYVRTGYAEAGTVVGMVTCAGALAWARRRGKLVIA